MRLNTLPLKLTPDERELLQSSMLKENFRRGKVLARIAIGMEICLSVLDIADSISKMNGSFHFSFYFFMYMFMGLVNVFFLFAAARYKKLKDRSGNTFKVYEFIFISYTAIFMMWGIIITLAEQSHNGQLMVFVVNVICTSVIFFYNARTLLLTYGFSAAVLFAGLPYFQASNDVLISDYIYLTILLFFSWVASRILFVAYCSNFHSKIMLNQTNKRLEEEIAENKYVYQKLEEANKELRRMTLVDELTGIPNRRAFYQYVEHFLACQTDNEHVASLIMMDIDCFKLYNDHYGHAEGDKVIKAIGQEANAAVRHSMDFAARIGGEEFVFLSFDADENEIVRIAESVRSRVLGLRIPHGPSEVSEYVTISLGTAAGTVRNRKDFEEVMRLADEALYSAKSSGRNCVKGIHAMESESGSI